MTRATLLALALFMLASCVNVEIRPEDTLTAEEHFSLGAAYESRGEIELALREYEKAIDEGFPGAAPYLASGNALAKKRSFKEAEEMYMKALEVEPENAFVLNNLGWVLMEAGRLVEARERVGKALEADPAGTHVYLDTLGVIGTREKKFGEAEADFTRALNAAPPTGGARRSILMHMIELYRISGQAEKASEAESELEKTGGAR